MTLESEAANGIDVTQVKKEEILKRARSAYEAVVALAKEARRLNAAPGVYLKGGEKPIPRAVKNFMEGKVEYQVEGESRDSGKSSGKGAKRR
jgi:DNA-directed RNA polymerase subunit K/omega